MEERYRYLHLYHLANESRNDSPEDGNITTLSDGDIAFELEMEEEDWQILKEKLRVKGFIEYITGGIRITNWEDEQFSSDSSTERVRKHRKRKCNADETLLKRRCNADVTPPDTDPDTDPDLKKENTKKKKRESPPATRLNLEGMRKAFNLNKPTNCSSLVSIKSQKRQKVLKELALAFPDVPEVQAMELACKGMKATSWVRDADHLTFDNLSTNQKLTGFYETGLECSAARTTDTTRTTGGRIDPAKWEEIKRKHNQGVMS
jgi:hypothetical protein